MDRLVAGNVRGVLDERLTVVRLATPDSPDRRALGIEQHAERARTVARLRVGCDADETITATCTPGSTATGAPGPQEQIRQRTAPLPLNSGSRRSNKTICRSVPPGISDSEDAQPHRGATRRQQTTSLRPRTARRPHGAAKWVLRPPTPASRSPAARCGDSSAVLPGWSCPPPGSHHRSPWHSCARGRPRGG